MHVNSFEAQSTTFGLMEKFREGYQLSCCPRHFARVKIYKIGLQSCCTAAVAEWYRYRIVACLITSSSPVPLKTHRIGQRCTLNLSRTETSSRWCGVVVRRGGASSGVVHVT
ncbi:uncharacterized protein TNCV_250671 [Trichonephila clavipes]|nr:uncharacterized protein TNCV_250671 [Trichonephila clavipes]